MAYEYVTSKSIPESIAFSLLYMYFPGGTYSCYNYNIYEIGYTIDCR